MTIRLKKAINAVLSHSHISKDMLKALKEAYDAELDITSPTTETAKRIEYLRTCLDNGVSKREAARMLVVHDSRLTQRSAESLVYMNFSGQYRTTMRGTRKNRIEYDHPGPVIPIERTDVEDDESLL